MIGQTGQAGQMGHAVHSHYVFRLYCKDAGGTEGTDETRRSNTLGLRLVGLGLGLIMLG